LPKNQSEILGEKKKRRSEMDTTALKEKIWGGGEEGENSGGKSRGPKPRNRMPMEVKKKRWDYVPTTRRRGGSAILPQKRMGKKTFPKVDEFAIRFPPQGEGERKRTFGR